MLLYMPMPTLWPKRIQISYRRPRSVMASFGQCIIFPLPYRTLSSASQRHKSLWLRLIARPLQSQKTGRSDIMNTKCAHTRVCTFAV